MWKPIAVVAGDTYTISYTNILQGFATGTSPTSEYDVQLGSAVFDETAIPTVQSTTLTFVAPVSDLNAHLSFTTITSADDFHGAVLSDIVVTHGLALAEGHFLFVGIFAAASAVTIIEATRRSR